MSRRLKNCAPPLVHAGKELFSLRSRTHKNNNRKYHHDRFRSWRSRTRSICSGLSFDRECSAMSPLLLMIIAGAGIALLLLMVLKYKIQPFVSLLLVSILVALVAGVKAGDLVATIEGGMGKTLGHIAIIIALGA